MSELSEPPDGEAGPVDRTGHVDCGQAIIEIYEYLDGELTVWKRSAIAKHLDDCPPCAQGFTFEIELRQVIATKCRDRVPPELKQRIAESLGLDPPPV